MHLRGCLLAQRLAKPRLLSSELSLPSAACVLHWLLGAWCELLYVICRRVSYYPRRLVLSKIRMLCFIKQTLQSIDLEL